MTTTTPPRRITVVVPTCDRPQFLRDALASIRAFEGPEFTFEIIVGDNGRTHDTRPIAEEFDAIHVKVDVQGASAARNAGLMGATGDYIAFLDDDDVWLDTHLRPHLAVLDARPELDAVIGQYVYASRELQPTSDPVPPEPIGEGADLLKAVLGGFYPQIGTLVARRSVQRTVGPFDEVLLTGQDWDWMLRLAGQNKLAMVETPSIHFRCRPPYSWDDIQLPRVRRCRIIFWRHALRSLHIWSSPWDVLQAFKASRSHFYEYFVDAGCVRAELGHRGAAFRTLVKALRVAPIRGPYHLIKRRELRRAVWKILVGSEGAAAAPTAAPQANGQG